MLLLFLLIPFLSSGQNPTASGGDTIRHSYTQAETDAMKSAMDSLDCQCTAKPTSERVFTECGENVLFKKGKIIMKGHFRNYKLVCGIECIYDEEGNLVRIKKYKDGKYIGDAPCPAAK